MGTAGSPTPKSIPLILNLGGTQPLSQTARMEKSEAWGGQWYPVPTARVRFWGGASEQAPRLPPGHSLFPRPPCVSEAAPPANGREGAPPARALRSEDQRDHAN